MKVQINYSQKNAGTQHLLYSVRENVKNVYIIGRCDAIVMRLGLNKRSLSHCVEIYKAFKVGCMFIALYACMRPSFNRVVKIKY